MAPQGHREPSVNPLTGITIEVKTLDNTIPTPSPSFHHYAITHKYPINIYTHIQRHIHKYVYAIYIHIHMYTHIPKEKEENVLRVRGQESWASTMLIGSSAWQ